MRKAILAAVLIGAVALAPAASALSPILKELEQTYIDLGERLKASVVNIDVESRVSLGERGGPGGRQENMEDLFRLFGIQPDTQVPVPSQGSGFIIDEEGHILTNNHVIRNADEITVRLSDGTSYEANLVGADPQTDVAVIKIDAGRDLQPVRLGDSDEVRAGQFAIAVGSPQGLEGTMSFGHITALGRNDLNLPGDELRFQGFIQTDAAINLGNSGGPLCDIDGNVIGINTAIVFGANSLGFAIPINTAKRIAPQLISTGSVTRGFLGVEIRDAAEFREAMNLPDGNGAFVDVVREDTPAERAGIQAYDVIRSVNGTTIGDRYDLINIISSFPPDETVNVGVWRDGEMIEKEVTLAEFQTQQAAAEPDPQTNALGLGVRELSEEIRTRLELEDGVSGVVVTEVDPEGPAFDAGVRPTTVILEIARENVGSVADFERLIAEHGQPGQSFTMRVQMPGTSARVIPITVPGGE